MAASVCSKSERSTSHSTSPRVFLNSRSSRHYPTNSQSRFLHHLVAESIFVQVARGPQAANFLVILLQTRVTIVSCAPPRGVCRAQFVGCSLPAYAFRGAQRRVQVACSVAMITNPGCSSQRVTRRVLFRLFSVRNTQPVIDFWCYHSRALIKKAIENLCALVTKWLKTHITK